MQPWRGDGPLPCGKGVPVRQSPLPAISWMRCYRGLLGFGLGVAPFRSARTWSSACSRPHAGPVAVQLFNQSCFTCGPGLGVCARGAGGHLARFVVRRVGGTQATNGSVFGVGGSGQAGDGSVA